MNPEEGRTVIFFFAPGPANHSFSQVLFPC